jgi:hypothetical protein
MSCAGLKPTTYGAACMRFGRASGGRTTGSMALDKRVEIRFLPAKRTLKPAWYP